jgi:DNA-binding CsgD family transcriptional regulator/PAS domain-containing protein
MGLEEFSRTLEALYAAVLEPGLWPGALERVAGALGGASGWLAELDLPEGIGADLVQCIDPDGRARDLEPFDPVVLTDGGRTGWGEAERGALINEVLRPAGVPDVLVIRLLRARGGLLTLNVSRPARLGPFGAEARRAAIHLQPHLARAVELSRRLGREGDRAAASARWDGASEAVLLVDDDRRLLYANPVAERLLAEEEPLRRVAGRLGCAAAGPDEQLRSLLRAAVGGPGPALGGSMMLSGRRRLRVAPLLRDRSPVLQPDPAALVMVEGDVRGDPAATACLAYQLTPAETRVALGIVSGSSPRQIAAASCVSLNTVRNQLQHVYDKTGARRQTELAHLLSRGAQASRPSASTAGRRS